MSTQIRLLRFADLKEAQVVTSWPQLRRLVDNHNFPPGYLLSPAVRVWDASEVHSWLQLRRERSTLRVGAAAVEHEREGQK